MSSQAQKKRKNVTFQLAKDDEDDVDTFTTMKVEHEESEHPDLVFVPVPPEISTLSPIQKHLRFDLWSDDKNLVEQALKQLADSCQSSNQNCHENRATVQQEGGASIIVGVMRKWYSVSGIQAEGCRAVSNTGLGNKDFKKSAKEAGALEAIISAMKNYPSNPVVQTLGCVALANMCNIKENAELVVNQLKGLELIIVSTKNFPNDALVQLVASLVLLILSSWEELRAPIIAAGGRQALQDAIETHTDESKENVKDVQNRARLALKRLM